MSLSQCLTLIRGLPGSGKSTLARSMEAIHIEADMYFVNDQGNYNFDAKQLKSAHQWCLAQTKFQLEGGHDVVVSNTFVRYWEIKPYVKLAKIQGIKLNVICCVGDFGCVHGVATDILASMKSKWQKCQWLNQTVHQPLGPE